MIIDINNQDRATIKTLHPTKKAAQAYIFSQEQKMAKMYSLEKYRGRFGKGFKMETFSPFSPDFNHCTYFTIA